MKTVRSHGMVALAGLIWLIASGLVVAAGSRDNLLQQAQSQYASQNYKQALNLAEEILASLPQPSLRRSAERIKALSLCKLPDGRGYEYVRKIMAEHKPFLEDGQLWRAMADERFRQWDRKRAYECYMKAGELFEKAEAEKPTDAADAYFKAAESLESRHDILAAQQQVDTTWQQRQRLGFDEMLKIYDHIVELKTDDARKAKALLFAGRTARREGSWQYAQKGLIRLTKAAEEFPKTPSAPLAQYEKGEIYEQFSRFVPAVKAHQSAITDFSDSEIAKRAKEHIDEIRTPRIAILLVKPYLPGEKASIYWQTRNVKRLNLAARLPTCFSHIHSAAIIDFRTIGSRNGIWPG